MKVKQVKLKQNFVPVIVTLESQEEVDALFVVGNHPIVVRTLPALKRMWAALSPFASNKKTELYDVFRIIIR